MLKHVHTYNVLSLLNPPVELNEGTVLTADVFAPLWYFALCRLRAELVEGEWVETDSCHYLSVHICMFYKNPAETKIKLLSATLDSMSLCRQ